MPDHQCVLPILWRSRTLLPGMEWKCCCGIRRVVVDTERPGRQRLMFTQVRPASAVKAAS